ncbi:MAG: peptide ABC transporter permease [Dictyoglomus sp. NZ13-RE01]|nr:MAG: peptide ABC transporter permease [Dictyoglomus sp. NZ13-RE01]
MDKKVRKYKLYLGSLRDTFKLLKKNKVGFAGFIVLIFIILISFIGPYIVPFDTTSRLDKIYVKPSWEHPLGTDSQGRDVLSQIVHGGRDVLIVAFLTGLLSTFIAVSLGSLSAFIGGRFDSLVTSLADIVLTIPHFPLLSVLAAFIKLKSSFMIAFILALLSWPGLLRAVRAQVLSLKERDFIEAARALDLGIFHIVFSEILPNMMNYIVISFILSMTSAVYAQVGLILLGLVPLASHNWGVMINFAWTRGAIFYKNSVFYILSPIIAISLFQWSLVSFTRSLEEIFNPRLGQGV